MPFGQLSKFACPRQVFCFDVVYRQRSWALAHLVRGSAKFLVLLLDDRTTLFSSPVPNVFSTVVVIGDTVNK